jgi:hypothetical protein
MDPIPISIGFVVCLWFLGAWLERIGGKYCLLDELLTPFPMALGGIMILIERAVV